ncbi:MAG: DUF924 domain-containing protein [Rickettsiaceae bacterium]|nr:DUF924 domain-containing protein [Rickettsiaceae bacterium]
MLIQLKRLLTKRLTNKPKWFLKEPEFDALIKKKFFVVYNQVINNELDSWNSKAEDILSLILVLDQFPRNMFRDTPKAFLGDKLALAWAKEAIKKQFDLKLNQDERMFLYMPLMHSELLLDQEFSVELYSKINNINILNYAIAHHDIISKFGRFPHRNKILGRVSTLEEIVFLSTPNSSF